MLTMRLSIFFILIVFSLFQMQCTSTYKVQTEEIHPINLTAIKAFKFFNPNNESEANFSFTEDDKRIIYQKITNEFKNLQIVSDQSADIIVRVQGGVTIYVEDNTQYNNYNNYRMNSWYYYNDYNEIRDKADKHIVLIINFLDPTTKNLLWQGTASGKIGRTKDEFNLKLEEAVHLIFLELQHKLDEK